jgi:VCBS repeat-containing protein
MRIDRDQRGITLVETIVAAGIAAMLVGALGSAIFLFTRTAEQGNDELGALRDVQNAGYWLTRDGKMAETTDLIDGAPPVGSMTLTWTDGGQAHTVTYTLTGTELQRNYDGDAIAVARYVTSVEFSLSQGVITADLTSSPDGRWDTSEQVAYEIWPRAL